MADKVSYGMAMHWPTICTVCGKEKDIQAMWMGHQEICLCHECAQHVLPCLYADAMCWHPNADPNAALERFKSEFWAACYLLRERIQKMEDEEPELAPTAVSDRFVEFMAHWVNEHQDCVPKCPTCSRLLSSLGAYLDVALNGAVESVTDATGLARQRRAAGPTGKQGPADGTEPPLE